MISEIEYQSARVRAKAEEMAKSAIGLPLRVRVSKTEIYSGTITHCEVAQVRVRPCSVIAQFRVRINNLPAVIVERLPR